MIINVSGLGWSGSGAVYDMLKEYDDVKMAITKSRDSEFCLLCDVDGLRDLEFHLVEKPCRISSYVAILRFLNLVKSYNNYFWFENDFNGNFYKLSKEYIDELTDFDFQGSTYYELLNKDYETERRNARIRKWLGNRYVRFILGDYYKKYIHDTLSHIRVSYKPKNFLRITQKYLDTLFKQIKNDENLPLVFDQMIPPDCPDQFTRYLSEYKCIFVRRDPRDLYIFVKQANDLSIPIPINSVDNFIVFYKKIIEDTKDYHNDKYLGLQFEDLVYNYDDAVRKIEEFLGIKKHSRKRENFDPDISVRNTQLFKRYLQYSADIKKIEEMLPNSLFDFEKYHYIESNDEIF